jgi:flagellar motor switch protein FliG
MSHLDGILGANRAAMVLLSIDPTMAREVMRHLDPEHAKKLAKMVEAMPLPTEHQQQAVLKHFERLMRDPTPLKLTHAGKYLRHLAVSAYGEDPFDEDPHHHHHVHTAEDDTPIGVLRRAPPERLGQLLLEEHPQLAAAIVSQLSTEQATKVLMSLEEERRVEIVGRLATISRVPRDLVDDASKALADALADSGVEEQDEGDGVDGKKLAADILKGLSQEDAEAVLDGLADKYSEVADSLRDAMFAFEDLAELTQQGLQALMREVTSDQLLPALKTASPKLVDKLMSVISSRAAETLREDLQLLRPMRLSEVEEAQKAVLEVAMRLAEEGRLQLPRGGGEELV